MRKLQKILTVIPFNHDERKKLEACVPDAQFVHLSLSQLTPALLEDVDVIMGNIPLFLIPHCKKLHWMQLSSAGSEQYCRPGLLSEETLLTNASGAYGLAISEHMLGMTLELFKNLHRYRDNQNNSLWQDESDAKTIHGSTALIVGMGDIGTEYAKRFKALGGRVYGIRRQNLEKCPWADGIFSPSQLDEYLPKVDVVALALPNYAETYHVIDERRLKRMKKDAILLNVGRGRAVDTKALCRALRENWIAGAALDVTDPEPLPIDHPLWGLKNAVITPHVSGGYHVAVTLRCIAWICHQNLVRYVNEEPLFNLVDPVTGYRRADSAIIRL